MLVSWMGQLSWLKKTEKKFQKNQPLKSWLKEFKGEKTIVEWLKAAGKNYRIDEMAEKTSHVSAEKKIL